MGFLLIVLIRGVVLSDPPDTTNGLAQYVAGLEMIKQAHGIDTQQRARLYRELEEITGISADRAIALLRKHNHRPEMWQKIQQSVVAILETYTSPKPDISSEKEQHNGK